MSHLPWFCLQYSGCNTSALTPRCDRRWRCCSSLGSASDQEVVGSVHRRSATADRRGQMRDSTPNSST